MSELLQLLERGPIGADCPTVAEAVDLNFREMCLWARWVDDLEARMDRFWAEALRVRDAWSFAILGWLAALVFAILWWRA